MCWTKAWIYVSPRAPVVPTSRVWYSLPSQPCACVCVRVSLPSPLLAVICALPWKHSTGQPLHMLTEKRCLIVADVMPVEPAVQWEKGGKKLFIFNMCSNYINPRFSLQPPGWITHLIQTLEKKTCSASWLFVSESCGGSCNLIVRRAP